MSLSGTVIGLDIGTQNCVVSQAKRGGIDTVLNEASKRTTPAIVSFQGAQRFLGSAAASIAKSNFKNTARSLKRIIGRKFSDPQVKEEIKWMPNADKIVELPNGDVGMVVNYNDEQVTFSCEQLMAMLLNNLRGTVDKKSPPGDVVISIPGWWNEKQRRAMLDACHIAGFKALRLLSDHSAAALSYGIYKSAQNKFDAEKQQKIMFIDIGYSNMSVAVVGFIQGKLQVLSSAFHQNLGGRDFDKAIFDKFAAEFKQKKNLDVNSNPKATLKLMEACEKAKQTLTPEGVNLANIHVEYLMNETDFSSKLSLEEFSEMSEPLLAQMQAPIDRALKEAGITHEEIESIEIIGGASRPKIVKKAIATFLKLDLEAPNYGLSTTLNLDEAIGRGCALNSAMLSAVFKVKEFNVYDTVVFPVTLTWEQEDSLQAANCETMEDANLEEINATGSNSVTIVAEKQAIPCTKRVTFRRSKEFSISAKYDVNEDLASMLPENYETNFATYKIKVEPLKTEEQAPLIRVDFSLDRNGLFNIASAESLHEIIEEAPKEEEKKDETPNVEEKAEKEEKEDNKKEAPTENKEEEDTSKKEEKKKKKYKKTRLQIETNNIYGLSPDDLTKFKSLESEYSSKDRVIEETAAAKNELEAFIYGFRDKMDLNLRDFVTEEEKTSFKAILNTEESWLYDEGFDVAKDEYETHFKKLKTVGDRYELRFIEHDGRPQAVKSLRDLVNNYTAIINSTEEKYDHITEEERNKVKAKVEETESWLNSQLSGQEKLSKTEDPVLTVSMINEQLDALVRTGHSVVNKRRPPPPKKETPKEEKKMDEDTESPEKEESQEAPEGMEVD